VSLSLVAGHKDAGFVSVKDHYPRAAPCFGARNGQAKGGHHNGVASFMQGCQKVLAALRLRCDHSAGQ
jgi:hypothetical protein